jgi:hypothetical protein
MSEIVGVEDHRVEAMRAEVSQSCFGGLQEGAPDAAASVGGMHGESVQVISPAVPAGNDRSDEDAFVFGDDERLGIAPEECLDRCVTVWWTARVLGRAVPEIKDMINVAIDGGPQRQGEHVGKSRIHWARDARAVRFDRVRVVT